jgi:flagellar hook assembly protein FlgD
MANGTDITFELPRATEIQLRIYNMQGKVVRILASGQYNGGSYSVHWDGRDENGLLLPSGSYFYRLQSSECGCDDAKELIIRR